MQTLSRAQIIPIRRYATSRKTRNSVKLVRRPVQQKIDMKIVNKVFDIYKLAYYSVKTKKLMKRPTEKLRTVIVEFISEVNGGNNGKTPPVFRNVDYFSPTSPLNKSNKNEQTVKMKITMDIIVTLIVILSCITDTFTISNKSIQVPILATLITLMKKQKLTPKDVALEFLRKFLENVAIATNKKNEFAKLNRFINFLIMFIDKFNKDPIYSVYSFYAKPILSAFLSKEIKCD